jgi:hypothetical protein
VPPITRNDTDVVANLDGTIRSSTPVVRDVTTSSGLGQLATRIQAARAVNRAFLAKGAANTATDVRDYVAAVARQLNAIELLLLTQLAPDTDLSDTTDT